GAGRRRPDRARPLGKPGAEAAPLSLNQLRKSAKRSSARNCGETTIEVRLPGPSRGRRRTGASLGGGTGLCRRNADSSRGWTMNRTAAAFVLIAVLAGLLAALGIALELKGYGFGALGTARLDGLARAATFIPLAAIYSFAAVLMMILPLRAAGFVMANAAPPVFSATLVLFATIVAVQAARFSFGNRGALSLLLD